MNNGTTSGNADALLVIASGCPHCPTVLSGLAELVKQGLIGKLEIVNATARPELVQTLGVRSVPWLRLGPFELEGLRSPAELRRWAERAGTREGMSDYFNELLDGGQLTRALDILRRDESWLEALPPLLANPDTALAVRVGIAAIFEDFQGSEALRRLVPALSELARHAETRIRLDAAHDLALTQSPEAVPPLERLLGDPDVQVREAAAESLATLRKAIAP
jgi:thioredoxin-like negative regulator of GroEL